MTKKNSLAHKIQKILIVNEEIDMSEFTYDIKIFQISILNEAENEF